MHLKECLNEEKNDLQKNKNILSLKLDSRNYSIYLILVIFILFLKECRNFFEEPSQLDIWCTEIL